MSEVAGSRAHPRLPRRRKAGAGAEPARPGGRFSGSEAAWGYPDSGSFGFKKGRNGVSCHAALGGGTEDSMRQNQCRPVATTRQPVSPELTEFKRGPNGCAPKRETGQRGSREKEGMRRKPESPAEGLSSGGPSAPGNGAGHCRPHHRRQRRDPVSERANGGPENRTVVGAGRGGFRLVRLSDLRGERRRSGSGHLDDSGRFSRRACHRMGLPARQSSRPVVAQSLEIARI